jgi:hypothetical protein
VGRRRRLAALLAVAALTHACGGSIAAPRTGTPPAGARVYIEVPYPPPAAEVEVVPARPREGSVWVDGEWSWQGKRWVWQPGGWFLPPPSGYFAPWLTYRQANGRLLFTASSWHDDDGRPLPRPAVLAPAQGTPGDTASSTPGGTARSP